MWRLSQLNSCCLHTQQTLGPPGLCRSVRRRGGSDVALIKTLIDAVAIAYLAWLLAGRRRLRVTGLRAGLRVGSSDRRGRRRCRRGSGSRALHCGRSRCCLRRRSGNRSRRRLCCAGTDCRCPLQTPSQLELISGWDRADWTWGKTLHHVPQQATRDNGETVAWGRGEAGAAAATGAGVVAAGAGFVATGAGVVPTGAGAVAAGAGLLATGAGVVPTGAGVAPTGAGVLGATGAGVLCTVNAPGSHADALRLRRG